MTVKLYDANLIIVNRNGEIGSRLNSTQSNRDNILQYPDNHITIQSDELCLDCLKH